MEAMRTMKVVRVFLWLLLVATGVGCTVGRDYRPPQVQVPAKWSEAEQKGTATRPVEITQWWATFNDPVLTSLIDRAVRSNHDLRVAEWRIREARASRGVTAAGAWPQADVSSSYSRSRASKNAPNVAPISAGKETDLFQIGFDAGWEIDVFGGVRRAVEAADADIAASEENRRDVLVTLLSEVARNYVEARGFQQRIAIAGKNITSQQETLGLTRIRLQAGLITELDVAQAEAILATTQSQVPTLESSLKQAVHRLGVLLGQDPGALLPELSNEAPIPGIPPEVPVGLPSDLLRRRPDVRRAERELAAATARIGVATADLFPRFSLTGAFGLQSVSIGDLAVWPSSFWSIGPTVRWPIFDAGRIRANIRVQDAREQQSLAQYEKAVLTSLEDVENALVAYGREQERRRSLAQAVDANRLAADLANERYTRGLVDFLNVLESQRQLYASEDQLVQSERGIVVNLVALYKALGGGWEVFSQVN
ncbi:MAG: efflux transporter outer membrane subunit [Candidatus Methylomirabilis sp.]